MAETACTPQHESDCYPDETCVHCGGCDCGAVVSTCAGVPGSSDCCWLAGWTDSRPEGEWPLLGVTEEVGSDG